MHRFDGADTAAEIIGRGPEPLSSQFAASYGLVLNLLSSKGLADARTFINRSFGRRVAQIADGSFLCRYAVSEPWSSTC